MAENQPKRGLGKGLSTLLGDDGFWEDELSETAAGQGGIAPTGTTVVSLSITSLFPSPFQPRHTFTPEALEDLVNSVKEKGVLQPVLARKRTDGSYELIAGERRFRAAKAAGLSEIPALIKDFTDRESLEVALIENLIRENLSPIEEAQGFRRLMDEFHHTQEQLAEALGKSRSYIGNTLRLLNLPETVKEMVEKGELSAGHARVIITHPDPEAAAKEIIESRLTVREAEKSAKKAKKPPRRKSSAPTNSDIRALEEELTEKLGFPSHLKIKGQTGTIAIDFKGFDRLDDLLRILVEAAKLSRG